MVVGGGDQLAKKWQEIVGVKGFSSNSLPGNGPIFFRFGLAHLPRTWKLVIC